MKRSRETENDASTSMSKKFGGAAIYKTKFQDSWTKKWPFVQPVKDNLYQFHCTTCFRNLSCGIKVKLILLDTVYLNNKSNDKTLQANSKLNFQPVNQQHTDQVSIIIRKALAFLCRVEMA